MGQQWENVCVRVFVLRHTSVTLHFTLTKELVTLGPTDIKWHIVLVGSWVVRWLGLSSNTRGLNPLG